MPQPTEDPRVRLAAERTLLAWIRTGIALMGFGFVVARFGLFLRRLAALREPVPVRSSGWSLWIGTGLVLLGVVVTVLAAAEHVQIVRRLRQGAETIVPKRSLGAIVALVLAALGVIMVVYLFSVAG